MVIGVLQFELVIDNPSYPDPFSSGTIRQTLPSVRVTDPALEAVVNRSRDPCAAPPPHPPSNPRKTPATSANGHRRESIRTPFPALRIRASDGYRITASLR